MKSTNEDLFQKFLDYIASNPLKGECLLIVAGASENDKEENLTSNVTPVEAVEALIASGMKPNQAIKTVAKERKMNRQELYNLFSWGLRGSFFCWQHKMLEKKELSKNSVNTLVCLIILCYII